MTSVFTQKNLLMNAPLGLINDIICITGYVSYITVIIAAQVFCLLTANVGDTSCCLKEEDCTAVTGSSCISEWLLSLFMFPTNVSL